MLHTQIRPEAETARLWLVRSDRSASDEQLALEQGILSIEGSVKDDLSEAYEFEDILDHVMRANPKETLTRTESLARQLHGFLHLAQMGDLVISPMRRNAVLAIGQLLPGVVDGPDGVPSRAVKWIRSDLSRDALLPDLMYSCGFRKNRTAISLSPGQPFQ